MADPETPSGETSKSGPFIRLSLSDAEGLLAETNMTDPKQIMAILDVGLAMYRDVVRSQLRPKTSTLVTPNGIDGLKRKIFG